MIAVQTAKAFELIRSQTGKEDELINDLMKLPQVKETHLLAGKWDLMATLAFEEQPVYWALCLPDAAGRGVARYQLHS